MGSQQVPPGVDLFENFCTFKICSNGRYIFAGMTKSKGIVIFDTERILYEMPKNDYGAPQLDWRPSDDQLIVISVAQGGSLIQIDAVPGIFRAG